MFGVAAAVSQHSEVGMMNRLFTVVFFAWTVIFVLLAFFG